MSLDLQYPIGKFQRPATIDLPQVQTWNSEIASLPQRLRAAANQLDEAALNRPYRPGGWTKRQVIHHVADSHANAYLRFKWTLAEDRPLIKAYNEKDWAELPEAKSAPIEISLGMLEGIHTRWTQVIAHLSAADLERYFVHPEDGLNYTLGHCIGMYCWHGNHHLAHLALP